jgi:hypothetical protein
MRNVIIRIQPHEIWTYGRYDNGGTETWLVIAAPKLRVKREPEQGKSDTEEKTCKYFRIFTIHSSTN